MIWACFGLFSMKTKNLIAKFVFQFFLLKMPERLNGVCQTSTSVKTISVKFPLFQSEEIAVTQQPPPSKILIGG
jgi:hypothetical protein